MCGLMRILGKLTALTRQTRFQHTERVSCLVAAPQMSAWENGGCPCVALERATSPLYVHDGGCPWSMAYNTQSKTSRTHLCLIKVTDQQDTYGPSWSCSLAVSSRIRRSNGHSHPCCCSTGRSTSTIGRSKSVPVQERTAAVSVLSTGLSVLGPQV